MEQYSDNPQPVQRDFSSQKPLAPIMTMGQWLVTMLLLLIPIVNIVLIIVWAVSKNENPNRSNWAKAYLILIAIMLVLYGLIFGIFFGALGGLSGLASY